MVGATTTSPGLSAQVFLLSAVRFMSLLPAPVHFGERRGETAKELGRGDFIWKCGIPLVLICIYTVYMCVGGWFAGIDVALLLPNGTFAKPRGFEKKRRRKSFCQLRCCAKTFKKEKRTCSRWPPPPSRPPPPRSCCPLASRRSAGGSTHPHRRFMTPRNCLLLETHPLPFLIFERRDM